MTKRKKIQTKIYKWWFPYPFSNIKKGCDHSELTKIIHWWYRFECRSCGKRFKRPPKGDYYTWEK